MNEKNNVSIEGKIVDGYMDKLQEKNISYASMLICSPMKKADGNLEKLYFRIRFPVSPDMVQKISNICEESRNSQEQKPHFIAVRGQLKYDKQARPFILSKEKDTKFSDIPKKDKYENMISLDGFVHKVLQKSPIAATLLVKVNNGKDIIPVTFNAQKNPLEWAGIVNGKIKEGDSIKASGRLDGKIYAHAPGKDLMTVASVIAENAVIKAKKLGRPEQIKPNQVK